MPSLADLDFEDDLMLFWVPATPQWRRREEIT
jgi:hypothetical protein